MVFLRDFRTFSPARGARGGSGGHDFLTFSNCFNGLQKPSAYPCGGGSRDVNVTARGNGMSQVGVDEPGRVVRPSFDFVSVLGTIDAAF